MPTSDERVDFLADALRDHLADCELEAESPRLAMLALGGELIEALVEVVRERDPDLRLNEDPEAYTTVMAYLFEAGRAAHKNGQN